MRLYVLFKNGASHEMVREDSNKNLLTAEFDEAVDTGKIQGGRS
jgi:hypothetical protein